MTPAASSASTGRPGHRRAASSWLLVIGVTLLLAFAAATWVQLRQVGLVSAAMRHEGDNLLWSFFQLELEAANLREALRVARRDPQDGPGQERLRQRYEIFASRLPLVDPEQTGVRLEFGPKHRSTLEHLQAFLDRHDRQLSEGAQAPLTPEHLEQALQELQALLADLHDLGLEGNRYLAEQVADRNRGVAEQVRLGIGLTIFQCALALAFAVVVLRQFSALKRRRLELEQLTGHLQEARADAEAASHAKSIFLANMSHELRTPFTGMLGMLTLLESSPLSAQQREHLHTARDSAKHLLDILNDILDLSKLESGRMDITPHPLDLRRLLGDVERLTRLNAQAKGLEVGMTVGVGVPAWVCADGKRLKQILFNLLSNAVKFTETGRVDLQVAVREEGHAESMRHSALPTVQLQIDVRDTGIGMDETSMARLFERFSQGDASTSRRFGGTGLGLEISRSLARLMGGDIQVRSRPGEGSVFSLVLPLALAEPIPVVEPPLDGLAEEPPRNLRPLHLLVVDDHPVNRRYMSLLLESMGHRVSLANDGQQALDRLQEEVPDLVFMDVHMPGLDGLAATRLLRQLPAPVGTVPVVALTADAFAETRERVLAAGMNEFLAKPASPGDVLQLLRSRFGARANQPSQDVVIAATEGSSAVVDIKESQVGPDSAAWPPLNPAEVAEHLNIDQIADLRQALGPRGYARLLERFFADEAGTWQGLERALRAGDVTAVRRQAHALKGSAGSVGMRSLQLFAQHLEQEASDWDAAAFDQAADRLLLRFAQARQASASMSLQ